MHELIRKALSGEFKTCVRDLIVSAHPNLGKRAGSVRDLAKGMAEAYMRDEWQHRARPSTWHIIETYLQKHKCRLAPTAVPFHRKKSNPDW